MSDEKGLPDQVPLKLRCSESEHNKYRTDSKGISSFSLNEQIEVENNVGALYSSFRKLMNEDIQDQLPYLDRQKHANYLKKGIRSLSSSYDCLDASQTWLLYWMLHSMELLAISIQDDIANDIVKHLNNCQNVGGGFGGGPQQQSHLAPSYGAVCSLCIVGTDEALKVIDRDKMYAWLMSLRQPDGSFIMHEGGEADVRGVYCAAVIAKLINIFTDELFEGTAQWVVKCQTYEGGFGGVPGLEAHGGYSFCAIAALSLMNKQHDCNLKALLRWTANRQMAFEGGFQGRTNKLVDSCYSFWNGGMFPLIHRALSLNNDGALSSKSWLFNEKALQEYVLVCCQSNNGGLIDKPGKATDYYHTCYSLSGLSVAQHFDFHNLHHPKVIGSRANALHLTHPVFNIGHEATNRARDYFLKQPLPTDI